MINSWYSGRTQTSPRDPRGPQISQSIAWPCTGNHLRHLRRNPVANQIMTEIDRL